MKKMLQPVLFVMVLVVVALSFSSCFSSKSKFGCPERIQAPEMSLQPVSPVMGALFN